MINNIYQTKVSIKNKKGPILDLFCRYAYLPLLVRGNPTICFLTSYISTKKPSSDQQLLKAGTW